MKNIIYIAGYGRSGSTLLERILGSNDYLFGLGEVKFIFDSLINGNSFCSCGKKVQNCDYWGKVIKETGLEDNDVIKGFEKMRKESEYFHTLIFKLFNSDQKRYIKLIDDLYNNIIKYASPETKYIIDSSKTARDSFFRPFILSKEFNVKIIHLIRDGRGCMWSNIKGSNRKMEKGLDPNLKFPSLRTSISWTLANLSPHLYYMTHKRDNYIRVKYENLVEYPKKTLEDIGDYLSVDLTEQINMLENQKVIPLGHQLAGNRLRKKRKIILKNDNEWKEKLNLYNRVIFGLFSWPLALKYNYFFEKKQI